MERSSGEYRRELRDGLLEDWPYAAHWVDSALKTAYSIFRSWRKNYVKGEKEEEAHGEKAIRKSEANARQA